MTSVATGTPTPPTPNVSAAMTRPSGGQDQVMSIFQSAGMKEEMAKALPKHMSADRMLRIALTEIRKNPKLLECTKESFAGALIQTAQLGLEPGNNLGHAYLLPYWNGKTKRTECQFMLGYKGMLELIRRTGKINRVRTAAVYEKEIFECEYGTNEKIRHIQSWAADKGEIVLFYCTAHIATTGECLFEIMTKSQVDAVKDEALKKLRYVGGPWVDYYEEMAKKTVLRRAFKYLPMSVELAQAITLDELADAGVAQNNSALIDMSSMGETGLLKDASVVTEGIDVASVAALADVAFDPKTGEIVGDEDGFDD